MMLTEKRRETLTAIGAGQVRQQKFGYGAWRILGATPTLVGWAVAQKLAVWGRMSGDQMACSLTDLGREVLELSQ